MSSERSREKAWLLFGLAVAAGVGLVTVLSGKPRPKLAPGSRLLLIGDSEAQGLTPHLSALAKDAGIAFQSASKVGVPIRYWTGDRLAQALAAASPTLVLVALGTNDVYGDRTSDQLASDAKSILAQACSSAVLWVGPPLLAKRLEGGARADEALAAAAQAGEGCGPVEYFKSSDLDLRMGADLVHPTAAGFASWAGAIWKRLS